MYFFIFYLSKYVLNGLMFTNIFYLFLSMSYDINRLSLLKQQFNLLFSLQISNERTSLHAFIITKK